MNEDNKTVQETQPEVKQETVEKVVDNSNETISKGMLEAISGMFRNNDKKEVQSQEEKKPEVKEEKKSDAQAITYTQEDFDKKLQETVTKIAYETRRKEKELVRKEESLNKVSDEFKGFVEYQMENTKDFNVDEYLKANPHYAKKVNSTVNEASAGKTGGIEFSKEEQDLLDRLGL